MNKTIPVGTLFCLCVLAQALVASDYTWTPSSALWLTDANWNNGSTWVDNNTALFTGTTPTAVTVSGTAQAYDVKVSGADYSFSGTGTIEIPNGYFEVANGVTATVNCALSQPNATPSTANRFRKSGGGTLVLKGNGSFDRYLHMAGDMVVDGGKFTITSSLSGADSADKLPFILANGGKFIVGGGGEVHVKGGYAMNCGVDVAVTNGLLDFTDLSGEFMSSYYPAIADNRLGGNVDRGTRSVLTIQDKGIVSGGTFRVSQNPNRSTINLNAGGVLTLIKFNNDYGSAKGSVNFNGGRFIRRVKGSDGGGNLFAGTDAKWGEVTINIMEGGLHYFDGGKGVTFNRPLLNGTGGSDGGLHITGLGDHTFTLNRENTYTGGTSISNQGTVVISGDSSLGTVPATPTTNFTFKGGTCYLSSLAGAGTIELDANRLIGVAAGTSAGFRAATNSTLVLNSSVSAPDGWINVLGNGTTFSGTVAFDPGAGKTNLACRLYAWGGVADFRSGTTRLTNTVKDTGTNATIYAKGNATAWSSNYVLRISGGEVVADGGYLATWGYGQIEVANALLNVTNCAEILNGHGRAGRIRVLDGGVIDAPLNVRLTQSETETSEIYLGTGGVFKAKTFKIDTNMKKPYRGIFYFDGGKTVTKATAASFFGDGSDYYTNCHVRVMKGGAKFDTNGFVTRVYPSLEGDADGSGGLVKSGANYLILHQPCTYTGATEIVEGTLRLSGPTNILWPGSTLILGTNGICEAQTDHIGTTYLGSGNWIDCTQTLARVEGCGRITHSSHVSVTNSVAPGLGEGGIGTLRFETACDLRGTLEIDVNEEGADCLSVGNGTQDLTNLKLKLNVPEAFTPTPGRKYTIVSAPAGFAGSFADTNLGSSRWKIASKNGAIVLYYVRGLTISFR